MSTPKTEAWFSHDIAEMQKAYNTNTLSAFAAAREAVTGFETLPDSVPKMFIYVGNQQNVHAFPSSGFMGLGTGKSASAHWLWAASQYFAPQGYRYVRILRTVPCDRTCSVLFRLHGSSTVEISLEYHWPRADTLFTSGSILPMSEIRMALLQWETLTDKHMRTSSLHWQEVRRLLHGMRPL